MSQTGALILAIAIIVLLLVIFVVSFILYRRTPAPKGCEHLHADTEECKGCHQVGCQFYSEYHETKPKEEDKK